MKLTGQMIYEAAKQAIGDPYRIFAWHEISANQQKPYHQLANILNEISDLTGKKIHEVAASIGSNPYKCWQEVSVVAQQSYEEMARLLNRLQQTA